MFEAIAQAKLNKLFALADRLHFPEEVETSPTVGWTHPHHINPGHIVLISTVAYGEYSLSKE